MISGAAVERLRALLPADLALDARKLALLLGTVVTDPKAWLDPEGLDDADIDEAAERLAACGEVSAHGMARLAWHDDGTAPLLFANGRVLPVGPGDLGLAAVEGVDAIFLGPGDLGLYREICKNRSIDGAAFCAKSTSDLLRWLLRCGVFDLPAPA